MINFELSRNIPIGQYFPTGSVIHRLDPRTKILATFFLLLTVTAARSLIAAFCLLALLLILTRVARLPLRYVLRTFTASLPLLAFFLLLALLFLGWQEPAGQIYFQWSWLRVTRLAVQSLALSLTRLLCLLLLISLTTLSTTITQLTYGVELLLLPLRRFGVPAQEIALINTIALRFVPTLAEELERVMKAQASRCGEIGNVSLRRPVQLARTLLPLIVPLFVNAFRRAEELAVAMEARCYVGGKQRTRLITLQSNRWDWLVVIFIFVLCVSIWLAPWPALHLFLPGL